MLEMGLVVTLGMVVLYARLSWRNRVLINSHPLACDLLVFVFLNMLHWGTFSGVMVAAVGALFCSLTISACRVLFGFIKAGQYIPGWKNVREHL